MYGKDIPFHGAALVTARGARNGVTALRS